MLFLAKSAGAVYLCLGTGAPDQTDPRHLCARVSSGQLHAFIHGLLDLRTLIEEAVAGDALFAGEYTEERAHPG